MEEPRPRYSVSGLMTYEACPHQYKATYIDGRPPPVTAGMRRGTSVHNVIARHMRAPALLREDVPADIQPLFDRFLHSRFNIAPVAVERPFVLPFDRGDVHGRIDLVLPRPDGGLELVDFKSGSGGQRDDPAARLQLPLYAMATARRHGLPPESVAFTYFYLGDGAEHQFVPTNATFAETTERVERIIRAIEEGRFEAPPGCTCYACRGEFGRRRTPARR
ncbi:MAG TPA: PD-(D/E)XK nuclease family protein [Chloroflexota bacterium]|nr:PD-(D/E)XK nuclease family protein [Chloroflexota bacterium]